MKTKISCIKSMLLAAGVCLAASSSFAALIPVGPVSLTGTGMGTVSTLLTIQNTPTETGSVAFNGTTDVLTGDAKTGASLTLTRTLSQVGITRASDLSIIFNPSEPSTTGESSITLTDLVLRIFSATGSTLFTSGVFTPRFFPTTVDIGTGNSGFLFALDSTDAALAQATAFTGAFGTNRIGLSASGTGSAGGVETFFVANRAGGGGNNVPEPGTVPILLVGLGLIAAMYRKARL